MRTVLVTIDTPYDSVDVELPAEIPLRETLPELLSVLAIPPGALGSDLAQLALGVDGQPPFQAGRTLLDHQVVDGMRLRLDRVGAWSAPQRMSVGQEQTTQPATPTPVVIPTAPSSTGGITVRWRRDTFGPGQE